MTHAPTPYPEVNAMLHTLLTSVQALLGDQCVGLYLYGSLASGDFDARHSDIDFVVVTRTALPAETVAALEAMHARLAAGGSPWAAKLEGTYVPQHALRRYDPEGGPYPCLNEGHFYLARHESDWVIQRHILREHGVVVAGPALAGLIDPVSPDDLRQGVAGILREWWAQILEHPERLQRDGYPAYAVLTMCRALYTLEHGVIGSKPVAARWAQAALDARWQALVAWALAGPGATPSEHLEDALDFVRYTVERASRTA